MGLCTASGVELALEQTATIATLTELWCGKMVVVKRCTANHRDGLTENITQLQAGCILRMSVHVLVIQAVHLTEHLEAIVIHLRQYHAQLPQPQPQPQRQQRCIMSRW